jgi:tetratricopeptide (TPR) repeat protein
MSVISKQLTCVVFFIILAFSPSLFAELCSVDDLDMYKWLMGPTPTFKELFFPQASGGAYYRPLIGVSYLFDKYVWLLDIRLMHLDNLLFHLANALLVYFLTYQLLRPNKREKSMLPMFASLLFGLHPLTVESVAWISGRTDIMAGTFVLLSAIMLIRFRDTGKMSNLLLALVVLIPGLLIKETPLAFLLGALFILSVRNADSTEISSALSTSRGDFIRCIALGTVAAVILIASYSIWPVFVCGLIYLCYEAYRDYRAGKQFTARSIIVICIGTSLPVGLFFLIRSLVFTSSISSIGRTMKLIMSDLNYACQTFFGAAGFYIRKFFLPFPLNFAIREIDPLYNALGVIVFFLCLYAIRRRSLNTALFLTGVCLFLPALPLSLGTIAWTAYAERYIYMSTAFWALSLCLWGGRKIEAHNYGNAAKYFSIVLILVIGVCTFQRSMIWRTNLGLVCDTVKKSPGFKLILVDYMVAMMGRGDLEGAKEQYRIAQTIPSVGYLAALDINMAVINVMEGKHEEAEKLYNYALKKTEGKSAVVYGAYISYLKERYAAARQKNDGSNLAAGIRLVENMGKLSYLNKDPMMLYSAGQLSLSLGDCNVALRLFTEAGNMFPAQSEYARISRRLAASLSTGRCRRGQS